MQQVTGSPRIEYVQQFDSVPEFWQYLRGLKSGDLIAELIQNELDANATHTTILFGADCMTCHGDGDHVDEDGWKRLAFITGAGDLVPRKRNRIGIKNHGIKVCFTIGDDINIRSAGKMINQTLCKKGIDQLPSPATYRYPIPDKTATDTGCMIEVPYRVKPLIVDSGEPFRLDPPTGTKIEELFVKACREVPQRFIGALRPDVRRDYVLELRHHQLGTARFEFSCGRARTFRKLKFYSRMCCVSGNVPGLPGKLVEACCLFSVPIPKGSNREIPEFYSTRAGFFLSEISWETGGNSRPVATRGHRRYPIEYGGTDQSAHTGLGLNFSGPYVSDLERRGAVDTDTFNEVIDNACKSVLIKVLRLRLIPRHGARAINLLVDPEGANEAVLREMVELMLDSGTFPLARHKPVIQCKKKGSRNKKLKTAVRFGPSKTAKGHTRRIVLPMFTWEEDKISPLLTKLCPSNEDQIDPLVPGPVLKLLGDVDSKGFDENHVTFDEKDIIQRLQPNLEIDCFPWRNEKEWKETLSDPRIAYLHLDVLMAVYEDGSVFDNITLKSLLENTYLPDTTPTATPITDLYAGINLPTGLPIRNIPPILHPLISSHRIFRKEGWKRPRFTFNKFLSQARLSEASEETRQLFWRWLKGNWKSVPKNQWVHTSVLPIWPDKSGGLQTLSTLCKPARKRIAAILEESLKIPHPDMLKIGPVKRAKRGILRIRSKPTESEIMVFFERSLSDFPRDGTLSDDERMRFHSFESDVTELALDKSIRTYLRNIPENAVALSRGGYIRSARELVRLNGATIALHLLEEDIIDRRASILDRIDCWKPREFPSSEQILRALKQDSGRYNALFQRLQAYLRAARHERKEDIREGIINVECIPDGGKLYAPGNLAFTSGRADYWGAWKHRISGQGLSADIQQIYRDVGVLEREPTPVTSREFFKWLNSHKPSTIANHLACVIRHINHKKGPMSWSEEYPENPFIPVEASSNRVSLVSRSTANNQRSRVFIPDFDSLAKAIKEEPGNRGIMLVILSHPSVSSPITQFRHQLGIKSLSDYAGNPISVQAEEPRAAPQRLLQELEALRGRQMSRELRKRLDGIGLDLNTYKIKTHWRDRLLQIKNLSVAGSLAATFQVGRHHYTIPTDAAFDEKSGIIWLVNSVDDLDDIFYRTIAERIFENPSEFLSIILKEALRREFREKGVYDGPTEYPREDGEEEDGGEEGNGEEEGEDTGAEPGGTERTHRGGYSDPSKNLPEPGKVPSDIAGSGKYPDDRGKGDGDGRKSPRIEEIQIEDLKQNHYAWHCQICLTERTIEQLAPVNSYAEIQENRSRIIVAHHADQVNAGGARHAGNILILCNYHHRFLGDRISRQDVTKALRETASDYQVVFGTHIHGKTIKKKVPGKIVTIVIPLQGERIKCFFTEHHAEYWIQKAT